MPSKSQRGTNGEIPREPTVRFRMGATDERTLLPEVAISAIDNNRSFSVELKPINANADPKALEVTGLSLDVLAERGETPEAAMSAFGA